MAQWQKGHDGHFGGHNLHMGGGCDLHTGVHNLHIRRRDMIGTWGQRDWHIGGDMIGTPRRDMFGTMEGGTWWAHRGQHDWHIGEGGGTIGTLGMCCLPSPFLL